MAITCNTCYDVVEKKIGSVFFAYGKFVARHPWKIIVIAILINGLLGIGMLRLNVLIEVEKVYTPINSQAGKDSDKLKDIFPDMSGSNFINYQMPDLGRNGEVIVKPKGGNILDGTFLTKLSSLYNNLLSINTTDGNGKTVTLNDICARSFGNCAIDGDIFVDPQFVNDVNTNTQIKFPYYTHATRGPVYYEQIVGGADVNSGVLQSATMLLLRVNLRTDSSYFIDSAKNWQESFLKAMKDFSSDDFEITYSHSDSLSEELNDNVNGDITFFSITFTIMITYACIATMTARCDVVGQRSNLGFAGVVAAGLAILASFGLVSACGVEFVSIVGAMPFLIIGIGVDDMFMLMSGITNADYELDVEARIGETMKTSGVSITITSLTDLLAFAAGASSIFLSVRNFCIYSGIAVIFCYINQATIFVSSIAINEKRMEENRHFATCFKMSEPKEETITKSTCSIVCSTGRRPKNQSESESYLDKIPRWLIPKLTMPIPAKIFILVSFAAYLSISIWGVTRMEEGLDLKHLVEESSYYYKFRQDLDSNFPLGTSVSLIFDDALVYSDTATQNKLDELLKSLKAEDTVQDNFEINWLSSYKMDSNYDTSTEQNFIAGLQTFLGIVSNTRFQNDVIIDSSNKSITASRIHVMSESITQSQEQGKFMLKMREIVSDSSLPVFAFSPAFLFYEQYVAILSQTLQTLGIAVAMVFFVTCIFMPHPLLLLYVTVTVAMITVGIFGFLPFLDLTLSAITMIHIIMSIGFSVDFAVHICHGYMISSGQNRNDRMTAGIIRSGAPIFHGAISSILGVIMLAAAKSFIFFSFFQVMSLVITFGILHALFLLPVILSLIGPSISKTGSMVDVKVDEINMDTPKSNVF
ncbi:patched domain-containing protein 3-like [Mercenaria mercenaria]|uniref:patched domain-containing protein 3-like n=1 Tax=Mercenaria mercenaria TaxID=6596 RepID=UPI00234ED598|nr:patched domain-containing protein 3-like [Mercenaria mercenaria]